MKIFKIQRYFNNSKNIFFRFFKKFMSFKIYSVGVIFINLTSF